MQKLALKVEHLRVQSFDTMPAVHARRGTVRGHQDASYDELACTDVCSLVNTCASCDTCEPACPPPADTVDPGRRIILY
jgi:ferredoxin